MNSDSTTQRPYGLPSAATSAPALRAQLGEPTGSGPTGSGPTGSGPTVAEGGEQASERSTAPQRDAEAEELAEELPEERVEDLSAVEDVLSLAEITGGLMRDFALETEDSEDPGPVTVAVQFDELTTDIEDHEDEDEGVDIPWYGLMRPAEAAEGEHSEEPGELSLQFGFGEQPGEEPEDGTSEDPLDIAALFGASGFTSTLSALEQEDEEGDVSVGAVRFADEAPLPRRIGFVVERRLAGACSLVCPLTDAAFVVIRPTSLTFIDHELELGFEVDVPSGARHAVWFQGQLVVLQGDGRLTWFQPAADRLRFERGRSFRLQVPCRSLLVSGPQLLVISEQGRCGLVEEHEVRWLTLPDRILAGGSGDPAALIASGRLGPYLVSLNTACELYAGPPLLGAPPRRGLVLSTLGERCWIHAPSAGVWYTPQASQAAQLVPGYSQVSALTAARARQRDGAWLALEALGGVFDIARLEQNGDDAAVVARVALNSEESSVDALLWDEPSQRLFICSDEALFVLKRHAQ